MAQVLSFGLRSGREWRCWCYLSPLAPIRKILQQDAKRSRAFCSAFATRSVEFFSRARSFLHNMQRRVSIATYKSKCAQALFPHQMSFRGLGRSAGSCAFGGPQMSFRLANARQTQALATCSLYMSVLSSCKKCPKWHASYA